SAGGRSRGGGAGLAIRGALRTGHDAVVAADEEAGARDAAVEPERIAPELGCAGRGDRVEHVLARTRVRVREVEPARKIGGEACERQLRRIEAADVARRDDGHFLPLAAEHALGENGRGPRLAKIREAAVRIRDERKGWIAVRIEDAAGEVAHRDLVVGASAAA